MGMAETPPPPKPTEDQIRQQIAKAVENEDFELASPIIALAATGVKQKDAPSKKHTLRMQELPTGGSDLEANNEQGNTFWATLDGRDEEGISSDGMVPPGDDLIEEDLKRVFSIDPEEEGLAGDSGFSDMDEVQALPPSL